MRFGFCTCVQIGLSCMEAIYQIGGHLDLIISLHDEKAKKKSGRIYVNDFAKKHNLPVVKINHINDNEAIAALKTYEIDWLFIIGWSQIASKEVIETPSNGVIGAHPTLLPEGRGRAAIPWAILKGLDKTGVTIFKMNEGVDSGLILGQEVVPICPDETANSLYVKVNRAHETLIQYIYPLLVKDDIVGLPQDESKATYWEGRNPGDGLLKSDMTLLQVDRLVRATTRPYPGAFISEGNIKTIVWAGKPGVVDNSALVLEFADGKYSVLDFEQVAL